MKNFRILEVEKLQDASHYTLVEPGIYNDVNDGGGFATHRMAMGMELEPEENSQYPLEDILDKYLVHVAEFLPSTEENQPRYIMGGELDSLQNLKTIIGKRAYNENYVDDAGQTRVKLVIE